MVAAVTKIKDGRMVFVDLTPTLQCNNRAVRTYSSYALGADTVN